MRRSIGWRWPLAAWAALLVLSPPREASAQPVIGPGQERAVLALFAPHELGGEVRAGHVLWNVSIERSRVVVTLRAADESETTLTLMHPDDAPEHAARTSSFGIVEDGATASAPTRARRALLEVIRANDRGGFWEAADDSVTTAAPTPPRFGVRELGLGRWGQSDWVPLDGLAVILLLYALALLLAGRLLADAPRWMGPALAAVVAAGVLVRLALSPATFLGAWPWSRLYPHVRAVASGEWITAAADHAGHPFALTDVMMETNFAYAAAMPLVLFSHATYLLRDARAGLVAAFVVAFLPQHIRFSRCEDGFVASLVLTSLAFALIHGWLRDGSRVVRWLLILALPLVLYPGYLLRPLNLLFVVVYAIAIVALHRETAPQWRRMVALGVVSAVGSLAAAELLGQNAETARSVVQLGVWLRNLAAVIVSPRLLVLGDPTRTPPALIALAVVGAVLTWRKGERRLVLFLGGWLLLFVLAHAVVVQETMQPRYHLHLVVPFVLFAACAVTRLAPRYRSWLVAAAALMVASPWIHRAFIEDVDYAELHEYQLVHRASELVPEGCTVLEYSAGPYELDDLRFSRIGALVGDSRAQRFRAVGVLADGRTQPSEPSLDAILREPPSCLYLYEGLACFRDRIEGELQARACTGLRQRIAERRSLEPVLGASVRARLYDAANDGPRPAPPDTRIPLGLWRVHAEPPGS